MSEGLMYRCKACGRLLPESAFSTKTDRGRPARMAYCRPCDSDRKKADYWRKRAS